MVILPTSAEDYLGNDGMIEIATLLNPDNVNKQRRLAGLLFRQLIYPCSNLREGTSLSDFHNSTYARAIRPADIGLVITTRAAVGMPQTQNQGSPEPNLRQTLHEQTFGPAPNHREAVAQVAGILSLEQRPQVITDILTPRAQNTLPALNAYLRQLIESS